MREIKFRGKRIDNGEWIVGWYHELNHGDHRGKAFILPSYASALYSYEVDPDTGGQHIAGGIFEGDFVDMNDRGHHHYIHLAKYSEEEGSFIFTCDGKNYGLSEMYLDNCNVIGNRWDNPELLGDV